MSVHFYIALVAVALGFSTASIAHASEMSNGLSTNGLSTNGLSTNGLSTNGLSTNGLSTNGLSTNGRDVNASRLQLDSVVLSDGSVVVFQ